MELKTIEEKVAAIMRGEKIEYYSNKSGEWSETCSPLSTWSIEVINDFRMRIKPTYADFKIDDKVMASPDGQNWIKRHFAGVSDKGLAMVFSDGLTSFTTEGITVTAAHCRRPTPDEMK